MMAATPEYVSAAMAAAAVGSGSGGWSERGEEGSRAMLCAHWRRQERDGKAKTSVVGELERDGQMVKQTSGAGQDND